MQWPLNTLHLYIVTCSLFALCLPLLLRLSIQITPLLDWSWIPKVFCFFFYFPDNCVVGCSTAKWARPWNIQGKFPPGIKHVFMQDSSSFIQVLWRNFSWGMLSKHQHTWDAAICIHLLSAYCKEESPGFSRRGLMPSWRHHLIDWFTS